MTMQRVLKWIGTFVVVLLLASGALWFFLFKPPAPGTPGKPIQTAAGPVRGLTRDGLTYYLGIPYAAPPIRQSRWRAPQPVAAWRKPRDAFTFSKACPQAGAPATGLPPEPQSEDCLYLNVWTPAAERGANLPVIMWIHGGSNTNGSASVPSYWGERLARKGAVVVSPNYRLGVLGFLAHPELTAESGHGASGNYGMMDILAALGWVRANAAAFGGDPNNVTVMGHSAGAWNMSHLQVSPLAAKLYRRIIAMSGGAFGPPDTPQGVATLAEAEAAGLHFAAALGANSLADLRALPAGKLVSAPIDQWAATENGSHTMGIVDGWVVPRDPYTLYATGKANPADLLIGYTSKEGANWAPGPVKMADFRRQTEVQYAPLSAEFLALYPARSDVEATRSNQRLQGERAFKWQVATWARMHEQGNRGKVWFYRFDHTPGIGPFRAIGPGHGAELGHVFDFPKRGLRYGTQWPWNARKDITLIDTMQGYWLNFARSGNPNGPGLPLWPSFADGAQIMLLDSNPHAAAWPDAEEHRLMDRYMQALRSRTTAD